MNFNEKTLKQLQDYLNAPETSASEKLDGALRLLADYRSSLLQDKLLQECGVTVQTGPFQGMTLLETVVEGCYIPKLLGCYEAELHPYIEAVAQRGYQRVVNIGAGDGYYAVGLARLMPSAEILAYDISPQARAACRTLVEINGVSQQVTIREEFKGEDFQALVEDGKRTLVLCDIEGSELDLLDPVSYPALRELDLIVECHDLFAPHISTALKERFAKSHEITFVLHGGRIVELPELFQHLPPLDSLLAVWEKRYGPTPWLVMLSR
jgi:hypothetical protein